MDAEAEAAACRHSSWEAYLATSAAAAEAGVQAAAGAEEVLVAAVDLEVDLVGVATSEAEVPEVVGNAADFHNEHR